MKYITKLHKICKDNLELIENFQSAANDNFKGWVLHHRLELTIDGEEVHTPSSLERLDMYYHRPYFELIFMRRGEHIALHNAARKGKFSEARRKAISEATKLAMADPIIKERYMNNRYKFPKGNYYGKLR